MDDSAEFLSDVDRLEYIEYGIQTVDNPVDNGPADVGELAGQAFIVEDKTDKEAKEAEEVMDYLRSNLGTSNTVTVFYSVTPVNTETSVEVTPESPILRCYIAGPMTGIRDYNRAAFEGGAAWAGLMGYEAVSPWELTRPDHAGECPPGDIFVHRGMSHPYACWFRGAVRLLLTCDCVLMLPGWGSSAGATLERQLAEKMGMQIFHWSVITGG